MAKFLDTRTAVSELYRLIRAAESTLILVSPYLKLSSDFRELLVDRSRHNKVTRIVFGKEELKPDEMEFLNSLQHVSLLFYKNLHAKCYVNDTKMIITSLNLYEFSMANNKEMGVLIDRGDPVDAQLFEDAMEEINFIQRNSLPFDPGPYGDALSDEPRDASLKEVSDRPTQVSPSADTSEVEADSGYCVRTGVEIPFNLEKPLSYGAYKRWKKYGDPEYPEKFCHFSGEPSQGETSVSKPVLAKYWKKAVEVHGISNQMESASAWSDEELDDDMPF